MSENVSTQLPNPPELRPLPSLRARIWQIVSYSLIIGGLALICSGGTIYYQNLLEASKPPPAPILEVSIAVVDTPTSEPSPTEIKPTATPTQVSFDTPEAAPTEIPTATLEPTALPTTEPTATLEVEDPDEREETFQVTPDSTVVAEALEKITISQELVPEEAAPVSQEIAPTEEPTAETVLSLEEYPLVVQETEGQPPAAAEPVPSEAAPAALSGLTRIVAESIHLDSPVVEVGWKQGMHNGQPINVWVVAEYAAGWHKNSMLPGQGGNIVLSGHHNIKGEVFRYIVDLEPGAIISLYMDGQRYDYAVADKFIVKDKGEPDAVRRENAKWVEPFNDERVTLVTCWPYNNNTHRVIVIAKPV